MTTTWVIAFSSNTFTCCKYCGTCTNNLGSGVGDLPCPATKSPTNDTLFPSQKTVADPGPTMTARLGFAFTLVNGHTFIYHRKGPGPLFVFGSYQLILSN